MASTRGGLAYHQSWAVWLQAKELSRRVRARRRQRTSSARRPRVPVWQRVQGLIEDTVARVDVGTPTFHLVSARVLAIAKRLCRGDVREWRLASSIRRQPGLAAWCFLFVAITIGIRASDRQRVPETVQATRHRVWLEARAAEAVVKTLATIGHGIEIHVVEAKPLEDGVLGHYRSWENAIAVNSNHVFSETELLDVAGHECVHAIFHQAELWPSSTHPRQYSLLNESAAYVLGAHIAGRVWSRRGFDGEVLTDRLVHEYREACNPTLPTSVHQMIASSYGPGGRSWLAPERELSLTGHFGSPTTVDEMDRICRLNYDPLDAARAIAERFKGADPENREKTPVASSRLPARKQD